MTLSANSILASSELGVIADQLLVEVNVRNSYKIQFSSFDISWR